MKATDFDFKAAGYEGVGTIVTDARYLGDVKIDRTVLSGERSSGT